MNHIRFIRLKNFPDRLQADTVLMRSPPWRQPSIQGRARHSNGKRPQRHLTNFYDRPTSPLRRPLDSAEHAKALLATPAPSVTDIALELGFSETSSFTAAFRRATGI